MASTIRRICHVATPYTVMSNRSYTHTRSTIRSSSNVSPLHTLPARSFGIQAKPSQAKRDGEYQDSLDHAEQFGHDLTMLPFGVQAKLTIGAPGDKYEQEADQVAAQVVQQINAPQTQQTDAVQRETANPEDERKVQTKPVINQLQREAMPEEDEELQMKSLVQREGMPEEEEELQMKSLVQREEMPEEEEELQAKSVVQREGMPEEEEELQTKSVVQRRSPHPNSNTPASPDLETSINTARGNGQPLGDDVRGSMEQAFGTDFSSVRIHTDTQSDQLNRSVQARAFTTGKDIFFRQGEYQPGNRGGQELLAHELTHVVQQNQTSGINRKELLINRKEEIQQTSGELQQEGKKPIEVNNSQAQVIGQDVLQKFGYAKIMAMATEAGLIEKRDSLAQEPLQAKFLNAETGIFRQTMAPTAPTFWGVFSRYAATAGVTSQVDSPAPGPADAVAIGILAIGLIHAGYTVLMASHGNPADTGIVNEAQELIRAGQAATICAALALLMQAAKRAGDKGRLQKIKATQKAKGCRHSRHS